MKNIHTLILFIILVSITIYNKGYSQSKEINYLIVLNSNVSAKNTLPFWLTANKYGAIPTSNNISLNTALFTNFKNTDSNFDFSYKASFTGFVADKNNLFVNELYGSFRYKGWQLDAGSKNDDISWEGLSSSNGNIIKSINTRAFPGVNLKTIGYLQLPFAKKWLAAKANYSEYFLNDKRVVNNARLHHKSLCFKSVLNSKLALITGLDHYVQWGGTSDEYGKMPSGFNDYLKIVFGGAGGSNAAAGEQINALGNTVGAYTIQLNYKGVNTNWNFYWSHPFEDRSGRELLNYPDALYGLFIDFKKPNSFITHLVTELTYTKNMSGFLNISGGDNYFNNTIYNSGWTYFGNTIGSPFFPPKPPVDGITNGIIGGYNRFISYHVGFKGVLSHSITYNANASYTAYAGWFNNPISEDQFSSSIEFNLHFDNIPIIISLGSAVDFGTFLPNNIGGFIKLTKKGIF